MQAAQDGKQQAACSTRRQVFEVRACSPLQPAARLSLSLECLYAVSFFKLRLHLNFNHAPITRHARGLQVRSKFRLSRTSTRYRWPSLASCARARALRRHYCMLILNLNMLPPQGPSLAPRPGRGPGWDMQVK